MVQFVADTERVSEVFNQLNIMVAPPGSVVNEDSQFKTNEVKSFSELIHVLNEYKDAKLPPIIIIHNTELLSVIIKYQDFVPCNLGVFTDMSKGDYSGIFESTVFPLERVSYQIIESMVKGKKEIARDMEIIEKREDDKRVKDLSKPVVKEKEKSEFGPAGSAIGDLEDEQV